MTPLEALLPTVHRDHGVEHVYDLIDWLHPAWHAEAACRGHMDLMFPGLGESTAVGVALCDRCPVRRQCAEAAVGEHHGIWAGSNRGRHVARSCKDRIADALADGDWHTATDIAKHIGVSPSYAHRTLRALVAAGVIDSRRYDGPEPGPTPLLYRRKDHT